MFFTISFSLYSSIIAKSFLKKFNDDLIYMRQYSITNCDTTKIKFYEDQHLYYVTHSGIGTEVFKYKYNKNIELNDRGIYGQITINSDGSLEKSGYLKLKIWDREFVVKINELSCEAYIE